MKKYLLGLLIFAACSGEEQKNDSEGDCATAIDSTDANYLSDEPVESKENQDITANLTADEIVIDGEANETTWGNASWIPMNNTWLGEEPKVEDYNGRFKIAWDSNKVYLLVEVVDDSLVDTHEDPLERYWDDDCVEIFIDENNSDDNHQFNHSAFAYHVGLDYTVVDIGTDSVPHIYPHLEAKRTKNGSVYTWELAMDIYTDEYVDGGENKPTILTGGKKLGFMIAYCDNDTSVERENFCGSIVIDPVGPEKDTDRGWIDAGVFNTLWLSDATMGRSTGAEF